MWPLSWTQRTIGSRYDWTPQHVKLLLSPALYLNSLDPSRFILMAGVQSTTTGWRLTALTCTQSDGARKQGTLCNTRMVRNTHWPQHFPSICFMLKFEHVLNFSQGPLQRSKGPRGEPDRHDRHVSTLHESFCPSSSPQAHEHSPVSLETELLL